MNFEDYETLWRGQRLPASEAVDQEALMRRVRAEARRLERTVLWRDIREIGVAFLVAILFAAGAWRDTANGHVSWGRWMAVGITLGVAIGILSARRKLRAPPVEGRPLLEQIDGALVALREQLGILKRVPSHYAGPLAIATICAGWDPLIQRAGLAGVWTWAGGVVLLVALAVGGGVVGLNRLAVKRVLRPKITELEHLRADIAG